MTFSSGTEDRAKGSARSYKYLGPMAYVCLGYSPPREKARGR